MAEVYEKINDKKVLVTNTTTKGKRLDIDHVQRRLEYYTKLKEEMENVGVTPSE